MSLQLRERGRESARELLGHDPGHSDACRKEHFDHVVVVESHVRCAINAARGQNEVVSSNPARA